MQLDGTALDKQLCKSYVKKKIIKEIQQPKCMPVPEEWKCMKLESNSQLVSLLKTWHFEEVNRCWKSEISYTRAEQWSTHVHCFVMISSLPLNLRLLALQCQETFPKSLAITCSQQRKYCSRKQNQNSFNSLQIPLAVGGLFFPCSYPCRINFGQTEPRPCPHY